MKNTETKWTKLISVRIEKEIVDYLNKNEIQEHKYLETLSGKINYILTKYVKEREEK